MPDLSFSEIKTLQRCHKLYQFVYVRNLTPIRESPKISIGRWIHAAIAAATKNEDPFGAILREYELAAKQAIIDEEIDNLRQIRDLAIGIIERFLAWHAKEFQGWQVYTDDQGPFVEREVSLQVSEDTRFIGIVDAVFQDPNGTLWVRDYKTQEDFYQHDREYEVLLDTDFQLALYVAALRSQKIPVIGGQHIYIRRKLPQWPKLTKDFKLSTQYILSDLETVQKAAELYGVEVPEELIRKLPKNAFFRHYETLISDIDVYRAIQTVLHAAHLISVLPQIGYAHHWHYRCPGCPFYEPCLSEWKGGDPEIILKANYKTREGGDPLGRAQDL